jgi:hypothetical protein
MIGRSAPESLYLDKDLNGQDLQDFRAHLLLFLGQDQA